MENNKNKKSMKFQGDMLNYCDFIQVFVFTSYHHLKILSRLYSAHFPSHFAHHMQNEYQCRSIDKAYGLEFYTDSSTCVMGTSVDIDVRQYM